MKKKPLKIWNGRGHGRDYDRGHFYVCATSRLHAARLIATASGYDGQTDSRAIGQMDRELRDYYSEGCWGIAMEGITPDVGVWATKTSQHGEKPVRIV